MDKTVKAKEFRNIFQNSLKINARSMSVKTLLSERNLKRIDYSPYYQRNYVWDNVKQTFFIESIILGTEVPPIILFKSGTKIEVIDGRQRFETLKRFKENSFSLSINGLKELQILNKQSFNKLSEFNKEIFLNSNIRIFEFEVINQPNLNDDIIDSIKKEIFRRYNTGITSLTREELDNAKYDDDDFSDLFKDELKNNIDFFKDFNHCFFPKDSFYENSNNDGLINKNVDFIRRFRILSSFPISTYASGSSRTEIFDLLYDFTKNSVEDISSEFNNFLSIIKKVLFIFKKLSNEKLLSNKLIYECIFWALTVLDKEEKEFTFNEEIFIDHFNKNISIYSEDSSYYSKNVVARFLDTADFFKSFTDCNFDIYIKNEDFKTRVGELKQTDVDAAKSIEDLSNLRLHKPNPISTPVDEIRNDLKTTNYLLRPSYQRQEKISTIKASGIIESILLGINLPPIFIYKRAKNVKEIVDGQQRLLAIIAFLGEQFYNEDGKLTYSKNNNYKLKGLKILTDLEGKNFSALTEDLRDKILDFVLDLIIIEESINDKFDPVDLFIRLNYKPYPIKNNSFEMWNSIVNFEVIKKIKSVSNDPLNDWFFIRERQEGKPDRMVNEELITILSYISYNNNDSISEVIGLFPRQDRITCRIKNKSALGDFLINLDNVETDKLTFIESINKTNTLISYFASLFDNIPTKEVLNDFLNVKGSRTFRRSLQDFYVIWIVIDKIPTDKFTTFKKEILDDIRNLLSVLKNASDEIVDGEYLRRFIEMLDSLEKKYN
ncbi:MAG: DUF262 domain-containing protein [Bacteroidales bacterium]|nr:DUF262 domain-containing protein [Bacteroidales bacterium]